MTRPLSACVGLDIGDVDFRNDGIRIIRKGGSESIVYFGEEVERALKAWIEERKSILPVSGHEQALFYSTQKKRMGVQAVENMVKKYAKEVTTTKKITPHKLRSTYGTSLYRETGDIYLVADVLGHKDVNTTKKHYAAMAAPASGRLPGPDFICIGEHVLRPQFLRFSFLFFSRQEECSRRA